MDMGSSWINSSASGGVALPPPSPPWKAIQSTEARPCWIKEQQQQLQQEKEMELKRGITGKVRCRCGVWKKGKGRGSSLSARTLFQQRFLLGSVHMFKGGEGESDNLHVAGHRRQCG